MSLCVDRQVAVVGAGISGICTAAHLLQSGVSVTLLERCSVAGGVWHFDSRLAHEPPFPNNQPSRGDFDKYETEGAAYLTPPRTPSSEFDHPGTKDPEVMSHNRFDLQISHAPPGPCYESLKNNVPLTLMKTSLLDWPHGLEEFVSQKYLEQYIQQISNMYGIHRMTEYDTRVENIQKDDNKWKVTTALLQTQSAGRSHISRQTRRFDAVVVASGHYHMPQIPDIPGLQEWKKRAPTRIHHSKTYRSARGFEGQKVLLIGSGVSSCDIAKDLAKAGAEVYQSSRGGVLDLPPTFLPENALRIGPVREFSWNVEYDSDIHEPGDDTIRGTITLQNGSKLCGLHQVILATGYITSYPFLPQYHSDTTLRNLAGDSLLVTQEGDMVHNLHKDIFYMEDPTLMFVGVPYHIATFSLYDFQAQLVARYLAGHLQLPGRAAMRAEYEVRVAKKGLGRDFHSLRGLGEEVEYVRELVEWANRDASNSGGKLMKGHGEEWLEAYEKQKERVRFLVGSRRADPDASRYDHIVPRGTVDCS